MKETNITKVYAGFYSIEVGNASFAVYKQFDSWWFGHPKNDEGKRAIKMLVDIDCNIRTLKEGKQAVKKLASIL